MTDDGPDCVNFSAADIHFADVYNDTGRFPNLTDVALELGLSYQTVRNKACILKGKAKRGEKVPALISRVIAAKEREPENPRKHARARATILEDELRGLLTSSRYPVINTGAVTVDSSIGTRYDKLTGKTREIEGTPRTWLTETLRVEGVEDPRGRRFLFTGAQNDAEIHEDFWKNLQAYADFMDADIVIGPGTYETQWWAENNPAVRSYAEEIREYLCFGRMEIGDNFVFAGEMNMLPTANRPISDLTTYSQGKWMVFPHAKIQLKSVPTLDPAKQAHQVMTTGMVTKPKIIPRKAGIKSLSHHTIGATMVEFDQDGDHFCRQITAGEDGAFYDLEFYVCAGEVTLHAGVDAINMGDFHTAKMIDQSADATFRSPDSIVRVLNAKRAFLHDVHDNESRNHHHVHDNAHSYEMAYRGRESVFDELRGVAEIIEELSRTVAVTVVESNHDIALERYVREGRYRNDGINIRLGLQLEDVYLAWRERVADAIDAGGTPESFSLLEYAVSMVADKNDLDLSNVEWVHDGRSYVLNGVECGHHGFRGANGARGSVAGYASLGRKMTIGDKHCPEICDLVYVSGVMNLQHGYNKGPSGWAVAHVVQYPDGNRTLITLQKGKWRAA